MDDDSTSLSSLLGTTVLAFVVCLVALGAADLAGVFGGHSRVLGRFMPQADAPQRPHAAPVQYEWVYTVDVGTVETPDAGTASRAGGSRSGTHDKREIVIERGHNPRAPSPPPGARSSSNSGKSKIEIIDIGGSMVPVDATGKERPVSVGPVAAISKFKGNRYWPMRDRIHPVARSMPASAEGSYRDVAKHIAARESNDAQRVKAVHDYIGQRLEYDWPAYRSGNHPPQTAAAVFKSRKAVCAGYARLFRDMLTEIGIEAVYVRGVSRQWISGKVSDVGHAWNAVKVDGRWYLVDATWGDDDYGRYNSDYLFVPPEVLGATHFPSNSRWQLRNQPITRGQFQRLPILRPAFHAQGLRLVSPEEAEIRPTGDAVVELRNPRGRRISASFRPRGQRNGTRTRCAVEGTSEIRITCDTPRGRHMITVWADREFVAVFYVHRR